MRFITEFELRSKFEIERYKTLRQRGSAEWLGFDIAKAFGWQEQGETTLIGPVSERHTLEIEAFPMDKWIEFKNKLFTELAHTTANRVYLLEIIKELESFSKTT